MIKVILSLDIVLEELIKQLLDGDINFVQFIVQKLFLKIIGLTYINFNFIPCKEFTKMVTINFFFVNLSTMTIFPCEDASIFKRRSTNIFLKHIVDQP